MSENYLDNILSMFGHDSSTGSVSSDTDSVSPSSESLGLADDPARTKKRKVDEAKVREMLEHLMGGTSDQESGEGVSAEKKQRATNPRTKAAGEFQVLPENVPRWTKKYLGTSMDVEQFKKNPTAQRKVFEGEMGSYIRRALAKAPDEDTAYRMAASAWYGGPGAMHRYDDDWRPRPNEPSFREYTSSVLNRVKKGKKISYADILDKATIDRILGKFSTEPGAETTTAPPTTYDNIAKMFEQDQPTPNDVVPSTPIQPTTPGLKPLQRPGQPLAGEDAVQIPGTQTDVRILDDVPSAPPAQAVTSNNEKDVVVKKVRVKSTDSRSAAKEVLRQIAPEFGIDADKVIAEHGDKLDISTGFTPGGVVDVTAGDINMFLGGKDGEFVPSVRAMLDEARVRQRQQQETGPDAFRPQIEAQPEQPSPTAMAAGDWLAEKTWMNPSGQALLTGALKDIGEGWLPFLGGIVQYTPAGLADQAIGAATGADTVFQQGTRQIADAGKFVSQMADHAAKSNGNDGYIYSGIQIAGGAASAAPRYIGATLLASAAGGGAIVAPAIGMGAVDLLTSAGKGESYQTQVLKGGKGAALGAIFGGAGKAGEWAGKTIFNKVAGPEIVAQLKNPVFRQAFRETVDAGEKVVLDPKLNQAILAEALARHGTRIGTIGTTGVVSSLATGEDPKTALKTGGIWVLQDLAFTLLKSGRGVKLEDLIGKIVRVPDSTGKPVDLLVSKGKNGLDVTDVGPAPPGTVDATVLPKEPGPASGGIPPIRMGQPRTSPHPLAKPIPETNTALEAQAESAASPEQTTRIAVMHTDGTAPKKGNAKQWRIVLPKGEVLMVEKDQWPSKLDELKAQNPKSRKIQALTPDKNGLVIYINGGKNKKAVQDLLGRPESAVVESTEAVPGRPTVVATNDKGEQIDATVTDTEQAIEDTKESMAEQYPEATVEVKPATEVAEQRIAEKAGEIKAGDTIKFVETKGKDKGNVVIARVQEYVPPSGNDVGFYRLAFQKPDGTFYTYTNRYEVSDLQTAEKLSGEPLYTELGKELDTIAPLPEPTKPSIGVKVVKKAGAIEAPVEGSTSNVSKLPPRNESAYGVKAGIFKELTGKEPNESEAFQLTIGDQTPEEVAAKSIQSGWVGRLEKGEEVIYTDPKTGKQTKAVIEYSRESLKSATIKLYKKDGSLSVKYKTVGFSDLERTYTPPTKARVSGTIEPEIVASDWDMEQQNRNKPAPFDTSKAIDAETVQESESDKLDRLANLYNIAITTPPASLSTTEHRRALAHKLAARQKLKKELGYDPTVTEPKARSARDPLVAIQTRATELLRGSAATKSTAVIKKKEPVVVEEKPTPRPVDNTAVDNTVKDDIDYYENQIENLKNEIAIEKGNLLEAIRELDKEKIGLAKKSLTKKQKAEALEDIAGRRQDLKDDHDDLIEQYEDDIKEAKKELKAAQRKLKSQPSSESLEAPDISATPAPTTSKAVDDNDYEGKLDNGKPVRLSFYVREKVNEDTGKKFLRGSLMQTDLVTGRSAPVGDKVDVGPRSQVTLLRELGKKRVDYIAEFGKPDSFKAVPDIEPTAPPAKTSKGPTEFYEGQEVLLPTGDTGEITGSKTGRMWEVELPDGSTVSYLDTLIKPTTPTDYVDRQKQANDIHTQVDSLTAKGHLSQAEANTLHELLNKGYTKDVQEVLDVAYASLQNTKSARGPETLSAATKANLEAMIALIGEQMYRTELVHTVLKETIQNSVDAVVGAKSLGQITDPRIHIHVDYDDRSLTFTDNGVGMDEDTVRNAYLTLGGSRKPMGEGEGAGGGLGMAKAAILFGPDKVEVTTIRDGVKLEFVLTKENISEDNPVQINKTITDEPNGTVQKLTFPESIKSAAGSRYIMLPSPLDSAYFFQKPLLAPVTITISKATQKWGDGYYDDNGEWVSGEYIKGQTNPVTIPVGNNFDLSKFEKFSTVNFAWGPADVYISKEKVGRYPEHSILSNGLFQFDHTFKAGRNNLPYSVIINMHPSVKPTDPTYPFNNSREDFRHTIEPDIRALEKFMGQLGINDEIASHIDQFKTIRSVPRVSEIETTDDGFTTYDDDGVNDAIKQAFEADRSTVDMPTFERITDMAIRNGTIVNAKDLPRDQADLEQFFNKLNDPAAKIEDFNKIAPVTFTADTALQDPLELFQDLGLNPSKPIFHNNLNVDWDQWAREYGYEPEAVQLLFTKLANLVVDFKQSLTDVISTDSMAETTFWTFRSLSSELYSGISLDTSYHGVYVAVPFKGMFLNPLLIKGAAKFLMTADDASSLDWYEHVRPLGIADSFMETLYHEAAHVGGLAHGSDHVRRTEDIGTLFRLTGQYDVFIRRFKDLWDNNKELWGEMINEYERSTTSNSFKSIAEDKQVRQSGGTGRGDEGPGKPEKGDVSRGEGLRRGEDLLGRSESARGSGSDKEDLAKLNAIKQRFSDSLKPSEEPNNPIVPDTAGQIPDDDLVEMNAGIPILNKLLSTRVRNDSISSVADLENFNTQHSDVRRAMDAANGLKTRTMLDRMREHMVGVAQSFRRTFRYIDPNQSNEMAVNNDILRQLLATPAAARAVTLINLSQVTKNLGPKRLQIFSDNIILNDLLKDVEEGLYNGKELPFNIADEAQLRTMVADSDALVSSNPEVQASIAARDNMVQELTNRLVAADLLPSSVLDDPRYFHRQVLDYANDRTFTGTVMSGDVRLREKGFQKGRTGSSKDFNTNYAESEFEWMAQAEALLMRAEALRRLESVNNLAPTLRAAAEYESEQTGVPVDWKTFVPDTHVVWQPKEGNFFYPAFTLSERMLDRLVNSEADLEEIAGEYFANYETEAGEDRSSQIKSRMVLGGRKPEWVIPKELAITLDTFNVNDVINPVENVWTSLQNKWKQWTLLNPTKAAVYNLNNLSGDLDIALAYDPRMLSYMPSAAKDLYNYHYKHEAAPDIQQALKLGVIESGLSIVEIPDINAHEAMQLITNKDDNIVARGIEKYFGTIQNFTNWRENILRLAAYRYFRDRQSKGYTEYGASTPDQIDAVRGQLGDDAANAKLARELIGDYGAVSLAGRWIRRHLIPFYSWVEINAPRYARMLRNTKYSDDGNRGARTAASAAARTGAGAAKLLIKAGLLSVLVSLYNRYMFPEEDKEMRRQGDRNYLIIGKRDDGSIRTIKAAGAFKDMLEWVGFEDLPRDVDEMLAGDRTVTDELVEIPKSSINKIVQGLEPVTKTGYELVFGEQSYPTIFAPKSELAFSTRPIRDRKAHLARVLSANWAYNAAYDVYARAFGRPPRPVRSFSDDPVGTVLDHTVAYRSDPNETMYWAVKGDTVGWLKKQGKESPAMDPTVKSNALYYYKLAMKLGDFKAADAWKKEYMTLGGTEDGLKKSIELSHPLAGIKNKEDQLEYVQGLSADKTAQLKQALDYYNNIYLLGPEKGKGEELYRKMMVELKAAKSAADVEQAKKDKKQQAIDSRAAGNNWMFNKLPKAEQKQIIRDERLNDEQEKFSRKPAEEKLSLFENSSVDDLAWQAPFIRNMSAEIQKKKLKSVTDRAMLGRIGRALNRYKEERKAAPLEKQNELTQIDKSVTVVVTPAARARQRTRSRTRGSRTR